MKTTLLKITAVLLVAAMLLAACSPEVDDAPEYDPEAVETFVPGTTGAETSNSAGNNEPVANGETATSVSPLSYGIITRTGTHQPVTRAMAAKMLTSAFLPRASIDSMPRYLPFDDVSETAWYAMFINAAFNEGIMGGTGDAFEPGAYLTLGQAQILLDRLNPNSQTELEITDENRYMPISYELWLDLYWAMLEELSGTRTVAAEFGINKIDVVVLVTPETFPSLRAYNVITDVGPFGNAGYYLGNYINRSLTILVRDGEIIAIVGVSSETPTIYNALIRNRTSTHITIFTGGAERTFEYSGTGRDGIIADITISGTTALQVVEHSKTVRGTIKRVTWNFVELYGYGVMHRCPNFKVYGITNANPAWRAASHLIVGTDIAEFVVNDGIVLAAIIDGTARPDVLRVAISVALTAAGDNSGGFVHQTVSVTSDAAFTVTSASTAQAFNAGDVFIFKAEEHFNHERFFVQPVYPDGRIQILSTARAGSSGVSPMYRGVIEIAREPNGFTIINEICIEQYLYAVLPSEMPTGFGVEALKVQAVTARGFAFNQFFTNRFARYGAQICDTTASQVYNNVPENDVSRQATRETAGMVLAFGASVVNANFFSTSAGVTANSGEVWAGGRRVFPTTTPRYLSSVRQYRNAYFGDLRIEENARSFFMNTYVDSFDSEFSWFRWNVTYTAEELAAAINANLLTRYNINPNLITTQVDNIFRSVPTETIGQLLDIEVIERGEGGNIMRLKITGTAATVIVATELNIRFLMPPAQHIAGGNPIVLNLHGGTTANNRALLPSAFFVIEQARNADGSLATITFYGGGNGHGVGMSQNGVMGMINAGYNYRQILQHFYPGTTVERRLG